MPSKSKIITILEENRGTPVGGNEIANMLGISRNAVWKAITELKEEGYDIASDRGTGYTLMADSDVISKEGVTLFLNKNGFFDKYDADINLYNPCNQPTPQPRSSPPQDARTEQSSSLWSRPVEEDVWAGPFSLRQRAEYMSQ